MIAPAEDKHAQFGRDVFLNVWPRVLDNAAQSAHPEVQALAAAGGPNLAELQISGGQARLESGYGLYGYTNKTIPEGQPGRSSGVINNWGAVQAHGDQPGFTASDTHADGTSYTAKYRIYDTPEDGAFDMLKEMTARRPSAWQKMKEGDIDGWAHAMRSKDPITGVGLYFEQSEEGRASGVERWVNDIAFTLNEAVAAQRGGPMPGPPPSEEGGGGGLVWSPDTASGIGLGALVFLGVGGVLTQLYYPGGLIAFGRAGIRIASFAISRVSKGKLPWR